MCRVNSDCQNSNLFCIQRVCKICTNGVLQSGLNDSDILYLKNTNFYQRKPVIRKKLFCVNESWEVYKSWYWIQDNIIFIFILTVILVKGFNYYTLPR